MTKKKNGKKALALVVSAIACLAIAVGGVYMWLTDTTQAEQNVFTVGNIDITLAESDDLDLKMVPGKDITKDPVITVIKGSEPAYVFAELVETGGNVTVDGVTKSFGDWLEYSVATGWTKLGDAYPGVYYRIVDASHASADMPFAVIADDTVTVKGTVTKGMIDALAADSTKAPVLTITGYAVQQEGMTDAADAWSKRA